MDLSAQVFRSVLEIDPVVWDALSAGRPFQSSRWYAFGEKVMQDSNPTYIVLWRDDRPVARAACWRKKEEWLPITSSPVRLLAERLISRHPLLMCSTPLVSLPGMVLPGEGAREQALGTIAASALELGAENRASFVIFSYIQEAEVRQAGWPDAYSAISFSDQETSLEIAWHDFESYRQQLAKSTRRNHRLHCKQADAMGVVMTTSPMVSDVERAVLLIRNVERFHHVGSRPWTRSLLENSPMVDAAWIAASIGNRLVGCCSVLGDGDALLATLLGLDYSIPQYIYVYYQIMYRAVRYAIERGAKILYGGGGAYEFKRRLGFRMLPNDYLVVAPGGKFFQAAGRGLIKMIASPSRQDEQDHPRPSTDVEDDGL